VVAVFVVNAGGGAAVVLDVVFVVGLFVVVFVVVFLVVVAVVVVCGITVIGVGVFAVGAAAGGFVVFVVDVVVQYCRCMLVVFGIAFVVAVCVLCCLVSY